MSFENLLWYGHATFSLEEDQRIYFIDPFELKSAKGKADIVFITHAHFDHCSIDDIKKILKKDTLVVSSPGCIEKLGLDKVKIVEPNASFSIGSVSVKTIPAYNLNPARLNYHPRKNNWVGYIVTVGGKTIYHAGDTDFVPEMKSIGKVDIALLPMGGTYTMDVDEAIEAANTIKAEATVPMHYRRLLGNKSADAEEKFKRSVKGAVLMHEFS